MDNTKSILGQIEETLKEQMKKNFKEGVRNGAIVTCATIYQTMKFAGTKEDDLLFIILKDLAKYNGCDNLAEFAENMSQGADVSEHLPLS